MISSADRHLQEVQQGREEARLLESPSRSLATGWLLLLLGLRCRVLSLDIGIGIVLSNVWARMSVRTRVYLYILYICASA